MYGQTLTGSYPSRQEHPRPWYWLLPLCVRRCFLLFAE